MFRKYNSISPLTALALMASLGFSSGETPLFRPRLAPIERIPVPPKDDQWYIRRAEERRLKRAQKKAANLAKSR